MATAARLIRGGTVLTGGRALAGQSVLVVGDRIAAVGEADAVRAPEGAEVVEASGRYVAPGYIDLQLNGAFGRDFATAPETMWEVAARLPSHGVTAFLPTIITSPLESIAAAQRVMQGGPPAGWAGAEALGLHLEGPFLNPERKGAHHAGYLRAPDPHAAESWSPEEGVRLVTLAPELPGALDLARGLAARGVVVGAGHSSATFAQALAGFEAGLRYGTHLFNAMAPLGHREPALPGALLTDARVTVGIIPDGVHVHPSLVVLAWRSIGPERLSVVTDAMAALGQPPGEYQLGDYAVIVDETSARLADGRLAGSVLSLDQAVRNLVTFTGCTPAEAVATVTQVPARLLGLEGERGQVAAGRRADLVLLDEGLRVRTTWAGGRRLFDAENASNEHGT